eukprot:7592984-Pyramimonas_sp.AAC.1
MSIAQGPSRDVRELVVLVWSTLLLPPLGYCHPRTRYRLRTHMRGKRKVVLRGGKLGPRPASACCQPHSTVASLGR